MNRLYRLAAAGLGVASTFATLHGLGWSISNAEPVARAVAERLPWTIALGFAAFIGMLAVGIIFGYVHSRARISVLREVLAVPVLVCRSLPIVGFALFLQLFAVFDTHLPIAGTAGADAFDLRDQLAHLVIPVLCLSVPFGAWSSLIFADFFSVPDNGARRVRNLVEPIAMTAALIAPALLTACLIIEPIFAWPGLGRIVYFGVIRPDVPAVVGVLVVYAAAVVLIEVVAGLAPRRTAAHPAGVAHHSAALRKGLSATAIIALIVLAIATLGAFAADLIVPSGPYFIDQAHWTGYPLPPGVAGHALGTDENGRDLLARLLFAWRTSLGIATTATVIAAAIGLAVAKVAPWFGDRRTLSVSGIRPFEAFPFLAVVPAVLIATAHRHDLNPLTVGLLIGAVSWPAIVPAFRAPTAQMLGGIVSISGCAVLLEVTLSSFGFGVQPPIPSLGNMFANMQSNIVVAPWIPAFATSAVVAVVAALYALSDELRVR